MIIEINRKYIKLNCVYVRNDFEINGSWINIYQFFSLINYMLLIFDITFYKNSMKI